MPDEEGKKKGWLIKRYEIMDGDNVYLTRYYILKTPWFGLYLHKIHRSDNDRELHDHPWTFWSLVLKNGYLEHRPNGVVLKRNFFSFAKRNAEELHRVELKKDAQGKEIPSWTLVLVGRKKREWGFETNEGWVTHQDFLAKKK